MISGSAVKIKKTVAAFLSVLVLMSLSSCWNFSDIRNNIASKIENADNTISSSELVRIMVMALNDESAEADAFSKIPDDQKDGLTFSQFSDYMAFVRMLKNQSVGKVKAESFVLLSKEHSSEIFGEYDEEKYGELEAAKLVFGSEGKKDIYIAFRTDGDKCFLASSWIKGILSIYNYSSHYFTMLDSNNTEGVITLLNPGLTASGFDDDVVRAKADALSDYYLLRVKSTISQYVIESIDPYEVIYSIPRTVGDDNETIVSHEVRITLSEDGEEYYITDNIGQPSDQELIRINYGSRKLICGSFYTKNTIQSYIGNPRLTSIGQTAVSYREDINGNIDYRYKTILNYEGALLIFEAFNLGEGKWEGTLSEVILNNVSDEFSLGNGIKVGMTRSELLSLYPFIDQTGYEMDIEGVSNDFKVVFEFGEDEESDIVKKITVSIAP